MLQTIKKISTIVVLAIALSLGGCAFTKIKTISVNDKKLNCVDVDKKNHIPAYCYFGPVDPADFSNSKKWKIVDSGMQGPNAMIMGMKNQDPNAKWTHALVFVLRVGELPWGINGWLLTDGVNLKSFWLNLPLFKEEKKVQYRLDKSIEEKGEEAREMVRQLLKKLCHIKLARSI